MSDKRKKGNDSGDVFAELYGVSLGTSLLAGLLTGIWTPAFLLVTVPVGALILKEVKDARA